MRSYEQVSSEPRENGKFLAIEVETKDVYLADTSSEAVILAQKDHPDKIFFLVKIGFEVAETMFRSFLTRHA